MVAIKAEETFGKGLLEDTGHEDDDGNEMTSIIAGGNHTSDNIIADDEDSKIND